MSEAAAIPTNRQIYRVALASIIGSVIEQYDFLVTGVIAATVWGSIFFKLPHLAAIAAAIGVYGIGIIIRPIGAYIFGHIADRRGRKDALVYALVLMGVSSLLIGLTPTYDSIGIAAPILLIVFRLVQGISFGAEFGTAATWVVEQAARSRHRAFWGAWVGFAIPIGLILGFGSVIIVKSLMTPASFTAWAGASFSLSASWWRSSASSSAPPPRTASSSSSTGRSARRSNIPPARFGATCRSPYCAPRW
jgi:MFS transporter, MHS family, shikimate and dehydroshikimate transport protein